MNDGTVPALPPRLPRPWRDRANLATAAWCLVGAAAGWFLLKEFAALLRPLFLAVFLCYVLLPTHLLLRQRIPRLASIVVLAVTVAAVLYLLAVLIYGSALQFTDDLPQLIERARLAGRRMSAYWAERLPPWLVDLARPALPAERVGVTWVQEAAGDLANTAAAAVGEAVIVGVYLVFLLLEAGRFPRRVRAAFPAERAERLLTVIGRVNAAIAAYLKVKVVASLLLAVPVTLLLWAFGVRFPLLWGVLTFCGNFIPYLGSVVACSLPGLLAFLQFDLGWRSVTVTALVVGLHLASAYLFEPTVTGRAVGLSPLVILLSLAFWFQAWGLIGMLLAVPLAVILKIVLENIGFTRPLARLLGEE